MADAVHHILMATKKRALRRRKHRRKKHPVIRRQAVRAVVAQEEETTPALQPLGRDPNASPRIRRVASTADSNFNYLLDNT